MLFELPEDGLAAYGDDGDDMMMALARKIVSGDEEEDEAETTAEVFTQAGNAGTTSEELLVDDGWKLVVSLPRVGHGVEPETIGINGNDHDDPFDIGPTVELVPGSGHKANSNGHAPVPVNGNGHHDEAEEPQQSLFARAEFVGGAAEAEEQPQGPGPVPVPLRAGGGTGARGRAGRREAIECKTQGEDVTIAASFPLHLDVCRPSCVSAGLPVGAEPCSPGA